LNPTAIIFEFGDILITFARSDY